MRKIVLTFGLIAGVILSVLMVLTFVVFKDRVELDDYGALLGYTGMVLAFLMIFVGVKSYRDNASGGRITFGRAFTLGLTITVIATACYVTTWEVLYLNSCRISATSSPHMRSTTPKNPARRLKK